MFDRFVEAIGIESSKVEISNIALNQEKKLLTADLNIKDLIKISDVKKIEKLLQNELKMNVKLDIHFSCYKNIFEQKNIDFISDFVCNCTSVIKYDKIQTFITDKIVCNIDYDIYSAISNKGHFESINNQFNKYFGSNKNIEFISKEPNKSVSSNDNSSSNTTPKYYKKKKEDDMLLGRKSTTPLKKISEIEMGPVHIIGKVFSIDTKEILKGEKVIVNLYITDYTNSACLKMFLKTSEYEEMGVGKNNWLEVFGDYTMDEYTGGLVINVKGLKQSQDTTKRIDDYDGEKRVELHLHTQMSAMDSTIDAGKIVALADEFGHKAIAITDHGVVQSYPMAYDAGKKRDIKVIYGIEAYMFDDQNQYILNCDDRSIDEDIVVFDIETTGLSCQSEMITEIGAARIRNGEIIDTFHTMVNPLKPIPKKIVELTGITDEMVKDAPKVDEALDKFYEYVKGSVLCAHNAKFDTSFINYQDLHNRFATMVVIDTLQMSRRLLPSLKNHKLDTLVKFFGVVLSNHHRADHDAKATAEVLLKMIAMYKEKELYTLKDINDWSISGGQAQNSELFHVILLAKDKEGLKNLYELVSVSHIDYFYKKPRMPKSLIKKLKKGLIVGSACEQGEVFKAILNRKNDKDLEKIINLYDYLEIQPLDNNEFLIRKQIVKNSDELIKINKKIYALGQKYKKPVVATCDAHFINKEEGIHRNILLEGLGFSDTQVITPLYFRTTKEMLNEFSYFGEDIAKEVVIENPNKIADMCNLEKPFPDDKTYAPKFDGAEDEITKLTYDRAYQLYSDNIPEIVQKRIDKELGSINGYGFATLYMIAQKLVKKSLDDGYLVGSRGSVGSSFVAYLSGITEVNPLEPHYICKNCKTTYFDVDKEKYACGKDLPDKICDKCGNELFKDGYDIPFEVFLGFEGDKVPDIDLNFSGIYQPVAHKYIEELFGKGQVFRAGTVSSLQEKTAIGFVKGYAQNRELNLNRAETLRLASGCLGVKRTTGQHPGGIVIVPKENSVYDFTPIQYPSDSKEKGVITTHFDFNSMHDILVKVDALGHDDPTMLRVLQDATGIDPKDIPLDDKDTMKIFSSTESLGVSESDIDSNIGSFGIPEFGTRFVRQMLKETLPTTMEELVRISGLSHGEGVWVGNAQDLVKNGDCTLKDAICTRDDIMNYLINKGVPNKLSFEIMEIVRKGKGKSKLTDKHFEAMKEHNVPQWFIDSCLKIGYMFPKAHAAAYVMMGFRIAWFKVHKPAYYYAAYFSRNVEDFDCEIVRGNVNIIKEKLKEFDNLKTLSVKDKSAISILEVVLEMKCRGIEFLPIDIKCSGASDFIVENENSIRMPFRSISGLGDAVADAIVEQRQKGEFLSIEDLCKRTKLNKTTVELMSNMGCFENMSQKNQLSLF